MGSRYNRDGTDAQIITTLTLSALPLFLSEDIEHFEMIDER